MSVRVDARRDADQHALCDARGRGRRLDQCDLAEVIDHDAPDPGLRRQRELIGGLVVAVEVDRAQLDAGRAQHLDLPARHRIEAEPEAGKQPRERPVQERLGGVQHIGVGVLRAERCQRKPALLLHRLQVVDVEGRAKLARQRHGVATADGEMPLGREPG